MSTYPSNSCSLRDRSHWTARTRRRVRAVVEGVCQAVPLSVTKTALDWRAAAAAGLALRTPSFCGQASCRASSWSGAWRRPRLRCVCAVRLRRQTGQTADGSSHEIPCRPIDQIASCTPSSGRFASDSGRDAKWRNGRRCGGTCVADAFFLRPGACLVLPWACRLHLGPAPGAGCVAATRSQG